MNKKVCQITTLHPYNDIRIFHKQCKSLYKAGFDVVLIATRCTTGEEDGVKIINIHRPQNRIVSFFTTSLWGAFREALRQKADIYHFHDIELIFCGLLLRLWGKKVIYDVHENYAATMLEKPYIRSSWVKKILSFTVFSLEKIAAFFLNKVVGATPEITNIFKKYKAVGVFNYAQIPDYKTLMPIDIAKKKSIVIFTGAITRIRGIVELITAFEYIENAELWFLGEFESQQFLNDCQKLDGWKNVRFLGKVKVSEVYRYNLIADIGIVTYLPVPNHVTAMPNKPFEYMTCGLPMVMSDFPYWREVFGDSAVYVNPADSKAIANAIRTLLDNPEQRKIMGENNRKKVIEQFSWQAEEQKLIACYKQLLKM